MSFTYYLATGVHMAKPNDHITAEGPKYRFWPVRIAQQMIGQIAIAGHISGTEPEVQVFCPAESFVIIAASVKEGAPEHNARLNKQRPQVSLINNTLMIEGQTNRSNPLTMFIHQLRTSTEDVDIRVFGEMVDLSGKTIRQTDIVGIHTSNKRRPDLPNRPVQAIRYPPIYWVNQYPDSLIELAISVEYRRSPIIAGIVHNDKFKIRLGLHQHTIDSPGYRLFGIESRHYDGYAQLVHTVEAS